MKLIDKSTRETKKLSEIANGEGFRCYLGRRDDIHLKVTSISAFNMSTNTLMSFRGEEEEKVYPVELTVEYSG